MSPSLSWWLDRPGAKEYLLKEWLFWLHVLFYRLDKQIMLNICSNDDLMIFPFKQKDLERKSAKSDQFG